MMKTIVKWTIIMLITSLGSSAILIWDNGHYSLWIRLLGLLFSTIISVPCIIFYDTLLTELFAKKDGIKDEKDAIISSPTPDVNFNPKTWTESRTTGYMDGKSGNWINITNT